jgi:uncharacterized Zn-binding protein involved in type VI secretion
MTTDTASTFKAGDMMRVVGFDVTQAAAKRVYEVPASVQVLMSELRLFRAVGDHPMTLGLCPEGGAAPSSTTATTPCWRQGDASARRLLSKGHPLGATGLAVLRIDASAASCAPVAAAGAGTISASAAPVSSPWPRATRRDMVDRSAIGRSFYAGHRASSRTPAIFPRHAGRTRLPR